MKSEYEWKVRHVDVKVYFYLSEKLGKYMWKIWKVKYIKSL